VINGVSAFNGLYPFSVALGYCQYTESLKILAADS